MKNKYKSTLISCYIGYITQSIVVNLAPLFFVIFQKDFGFSYSFLANLVLITFVIQIAVDFIAIKAVPKLGYRKIAVMSQASSAIGIFLLAFLPKILPSPEAAVLLAVFFYSAGGGMIEVVISPIVDALPSETKESTMSLLHSFYSWGQVLVILVTTVLLKLLGESMWFAVTVIWAVIPTVNLFNFLKVPIIEPVPEEVGHSEKQLLKSRVFLLALFMMICSGAAEQVMAQWASLFCEKGLHVSKLAGDIFGPCLFAAFMGVGRTLYGIFGEGINLRRTLMCCSAFTVLCYIAAVFFKSPVISLAGCALCGLGVSLMWPGMLSLSSSRFSGGPSMFAMLALGGDIGCSLGPYLTGIVSDFVSGSDKAVSIAGNIGITAEQLGLKAGILSGIIFPLFLLIGSFLMRGKVKGHR